jgi:multiple sugar transport system permease protein
MISKSAKMKLLGISYVMPSVVFIGGLLVYPLINSVFLSFHSQQLDELTPTFVGLKNYEELFRSPKFWSSMLRTFIWTAGTVSMMTILGVAGALLLNRKFRGRAFARTAVLLPFFVPSITACLVFRWMYNDINGLFNYLLLSCRIVRTPVLWLASESIAMLAVILVAVWRWAPFTVINVLARLETIAPELYDAAKVDGAGKVRCFFYITLPQIRTVLLIVIILRSIFMFNKFDIIWVLTEGGPVNATEILPVLAYKVGFLGMRLGEAASITSTLLAILIVLVSIYFWAFRPTRED